jgi:transposase
MRVTTAFEHLLRLPGVNVQEVAFERARVVVTVALRRRRLICPLCDYCTRARYDIRPVASKWRHLDLGAWHLEIRASLRRLRCPKHGVRVEGVPFARHASEFTRDGSRSVSTRSRGASTTATSPWSPTIAAARWCGAPRDETPRPLTASSPSWARSAPRTSMRSPWT